MQRTLCSALPHAEPGSTVRLQGWVHRRRELATVTFLVVRDRSGLAQVVVRNGDVPPEETTVDVVGAATSNAQAPGGIEVTDPVITLLTEPAATPPVELWRPTLGASLSTLLDHAPVTWRHPAQRARWSWPPPPCAGSATRWTQPASPRSRRPSSWPRRPSPGPMSSRSTTSADRPTSPRARSSTSSSWWASSSGSTRSVRCSARSRTTRCGTWRSTSRSTWSSASSTTTVTSSPCLRDVVAGMVSAVHEHAAPAVERTGADVPVVPEEIPVIHFRDALALVGAPEDEPDLAPEHERAIGAWALDEHGSDFVVVEGYPMVKRPFYTHPWPVRPGGPTAST